MLSDNVKSSLFMRLLDILSEHDFIDFILAFYSECLTNFSYALPPMLCMVMSRRLNQLREAELTSMMKE